MQDETIKLAKKPNYMSVPAAIQELDKIKMARQLDGKYWLDHAVTATQKTTLIRVLLISAFGGAILSLDAWTFANWIPQLKDSYTAAGSFDVTTWIASILYGGVTEEIMIRLFLMSGLALLGWKLFFRSEEQVPIKVLVIANILSALVFAAGHLPVTAQTFGTLTPLLLLRCFLLNAQPGCCLDASIGNTASSMLYWHTCCSILLAERSG